MKWKYRYGCDCEVDFWWLQAPGEKENDRSTYVTAIKGWTEIVLV